MSEVFKTTTCDGNGVAPNMTSREFEDNIGAMGKALGAQDKCIQKNQLDTWNASIGVGMGPISLGGAKAEGTSMKSSQEGCGNILMHSSNVINFHKRIQCTINQASSESSAAVSSSASITIRSDPTDKMFERYYALSETLANAMIKCGDNKDCYDAFAAMYDAHVAVPPGTVEIVGSQVRLQSTTKIKVISNITAQTKTQIKQDFINIVENTADHTIESTSGWGATADQTKSMVRENISNESEDIDNRIDQVLSISKLNVDNDNHIEIISPMSIRLENAVVDANVMVDLVASAITSSAIELGKQIASTVTTSNETSSSMKTQKDGADAYIDANKTTNPYETANAALAGLLSGPFLLMLLPVLIVIGVIGVVVSTAKKRMPTSSGTNYTGVDQRTVSRHDRQGMIGTTILVLVVCMLAVYTARRSRTPRPPPPTETDEDEDVDTDADASAPDLSWW